jgi:hypothetical protein
MPACGTPGRKRGHHREPVDPTIALTHTVDAIRILRPAVMAALGQTLPPDGRSASDGSQTVSGSPSVRSPVSAERRERSLPVHQAYYRVRPLAAFAASLNHLVGASENRLRHCEAERLVAFRLMTSSNLVGCYTGRSAGWEPWRIFPAYTSDGCDARPIAEQYPPAPAAAGV